jgi:hypothetical protein
MNRRTLSRSRRRVFMRCARRWWKRREWWGAQLAPPVHRSRYAQPRLRCWQRVRGNRAPLRRAGLWLSLARVGSRGTVGAPGSSLWHTGRHGDAGGDSSSARARKSTIRALPLVEVELVWRRGLCWRSRVQIEGKASRACARHRACGPLPRGRVWRRAAVARRCRCCNRMRSRPLVG